MNELLTAAQMQQADAVTITSGIPGITLMEAAGRAVADAAAVHCPDGPVLVLAGPGNNGGDGFIAARRLMSAGRQVMLALAGDPARLAGDAAIARDRWPGETLAASTPLPPAAIIIDALFGTGLDRPVTGPAEALIAAMNDAPAQVVAVDLPSGLNADTGQAMGATVKASATVTFFRKKPGHLLQPGRMFCGSVHVAQIGISPDVLPRTGFAAWENTPEIWSDALRWPVTDGHKYTRGHALVVSGPMSRTGAARLAAGAALRAGAGLVTLASPGSAMMVNAAHLTAIMLRQVDDASALAEALADTRFTCTALGPGLGTDAQQREMVLAALAAPQAAVLDADALTAFAPDPETLFSAIAPRAAPTVLTPHEGEFARLFPDLDGGARTDRARMAAKRSHATIILKGPNTIIATPDGRLAINASAPPWLATAGSGDVLAGIAAGLLAQSMPAFEAACAAVWMHGAAGQHAGPGLTAEDLAPALHPVITGLHPQAI